jgi:hypothetical protein
VARPSLARIRKICLSLPQATEVEAWGAPTFRVGKIFAWYIEGGNHHHEGEREGIWVKTDSFTQDLLVRGQPARYFKPPYVGPQGWTGAYLGADTDWIAITDLLREAYKATAPKKLAALVTDDDAVGMKAAPAKKRAPKRAAPGKKPAPRRKAPAKRAAKKRA